MCTGDDNCDDEDEDDLSKGPCFEHFVLITLMMITQKFLQLKKILQLKKFCILTAVTKMVVFFGVTNMRHFKMISPFFLMIIIIILMTMMIMMMMMIKRMTIGGEAIMSRLMGIDVQLIGRQRSPHHI